MIAPALIAPALAAGAGDIRWTEIRCEERSGLLYVSASGDPGIYPLGTTLTVQFFRVRSGASWPRGEERETGEEPAFAFVAEETPARWISVPVDRPFGFAAWLPKAAQYEIVTMFSVVENNDLRIRRALGPHDFRDRTFRQVFSARAFPEKMETIRRDLDRVRQHRAAFDAFVAEWRTRNPGPQSPLSDEEAAQWQRRWQELRDACAAHAEEAVLHGTLSGQLALLDSFHVLIRTRGSAVTSEEEMLSAAAEGEITSSRFLLTGEWMPPARAAEISARMSSLAVREVLFHLAEYIQSRREAVVWDATDPPLPDAENDRQALEDLRAALAAQSEVFAALRGEPWAPHLEAWSRWESSELGTGAIGEVLTALHSGVSQLLAGGMTDRQRAALSRDLAFQCAAFEAWRERIVSGRPAVLALPDRPRR